MLEKIRTACAVLMLVLNITGMVLLIHYNSALQHRQLGGGINEDRTSVCMGSH